MRKTTGGKGEQLPKLLRLSKQDKCLLRNDKSMLLALNMKKLDEQSIKWLKWGR